jgi:hypothetical protein
MLMKVVPAAIVGLLVIILFVHWVKPLSVYDESGALREFGLGTKNKTVTPLWLVVILAAIASYSYCYLKFE